MSSIFRASVVAVAVVVLGGAQQALAAPYIITAGSGIYQSTATFSKVDNSTLTILLDHSSTGDTNQNMEILTALFFNIGLTLTPVSALLPAGSSIVNPAQALITNVGGEWRYEDLAPTNVNGATKGISAVGFSLFGSAANFNGPDLWGNPPIDGGNAGIVSAGYTSAGDAGGLFENLIKHSVLFTLSGNLAGWEPGAATITNVNFQFGTDITTEPNFGGGFGATVPDGGTTAALLGLSMLGLGFLRRLKS